MLKKKSLGQHFLHNRHYLAAVADAAGIRKGETVVEIGHGEDALTAVLLERGARRVKVSFATEVAAALYEGLGFRPTSSTSWYSA